MLMELGGQAIFGSPQPNQYYSNNQASGQRARTTGQTGTRQHVNKRLSLLGK